MYINDDNLKCHIGIYLNGLVFFLTAVITGRWKRIRCRSHSFFLLWVSGDNKD